MGVFIWIEKVKLLFCYKVSIVRDVVYFRVNSKELNINIDIKVKFLGLKI